MKITLNTHEIAEELLKDTCARWSRAGAFALAEYLEEYEESTGVELELDTCAIRCDFSEYASLRDFADEYFGITSRNSWSDDIGADSDDDDDAIDEKIREYIQDHGQLIEFDGGVIVSSF
jgi:hypothetical protein